ncbi:Spo0B domain-containing protein [Laceyella putida]|uniref:Spo0B domain-containing protein n=1 Tax=Laceyella putida TaxID=110101 RepID=A0ABW2RIK7_9BACL
MERTLFQMIKTYLPTILIMIGWLIQPFGKLGELIFFLATLVTLLCSGYFSYINFKKQTCLKEAERIKQLLSHERHDALNHIQVMMGYMMLKKTDRIKTYLEQWVERAGQERLLSEFRFAPLAVALLTLKYRFKHWDLQVKMDEAMKMISQEDEQRLLYSMNALLGWLEKKLADEKSYLKVTLTLKQEADIMVMAIDVLADQGEPVTLFGSAQDWRKLQRTVCRWKGSCKLMEHGKGLELQLKTGQQK